eukprot:TRINITY_DN31443_c0_g1_i1.p1 TRINITY_DN31443_c0_g1~~TRINITY_DN31443_c0_g1_i1.p1  ORF type:complete len:586 (-),score=101.73 TRINITY_DN31443_c0_g1_i1:59-1792(-)
MEAVRFAAGSVLLTSNRPALPSWNRGGLAASEPRPLASTSCLSGQRQQQSGRVRPDALISCAWHDARQCARPAGLAGASALMACALSRSSVRPTVVQSVASEQALEIWQYSPPEYRRLETRTLPAVDAMRTRRELEPGEVFAVVQRTEPGPDGPEFLKLADGRGWVFVELPADQRSGEAAVPLCSRHAAVTSWRFDPPENKMLDLREFPRFDSAKTGRSLPAGTVFQVSREVLVNGTIFLELESGEGWAFDQVPGVTVLCSRHQEQLWQLDSASQALQEMQKNELEQLLTPPFAAGDARLQRTSPAELRLGQELKGFITGVDYEGAFVDVGAERDGWIHISQLGNEKVYDPHSTVVIGQEVRVWISQIDADGNFLCSMARSRLKLRPRMPENTTLQVSTWHDGIVSNIHDNGAFVILGDGKGGVGPEGFVYVGEIPGNVPVLKEALAVGDRVRARVLKTTGRKVPELSLLDDDVTTFLKVPRTAWLEGKVYNIKSTGVFVEVVPPAGISPVQGFVHISEMKDDIVSDPHSEVKVGDSVQLRVIKVDTERRRVSFSMRQEREQGKGKGKGKDAEKNNI